MQLVGTLIRMVGTIVVPAASALLVIASAAEAANVPMSGSLGVINPSVAPPRYFERGPWVIGNINPGPYAQNTPAGNVAVGGGPGPTFVGRQITLAKNKFLFTGFQLRDFTAFPQVAQVSFNYTTSQQAATFMNGGGALAACPGPGCTGPVGSGSAISWCPPGPPSIPLPETLEPRWATGTARAGSRPAPTSAGPTRASGWRSSTPRDAPTSAARSA